mgnify:CR=1 FL=1
MRALLSTLAVAIVLSAAAPASARRSDRHAYRYAQVWSAVVRLLRVDYRFPIRERDQEVGFVLFEVVDQDQSYPASLELARLEEQGREVVQVTLQVPGRPSYVERMILDRLARKLRVSYGPPLAPVRAPEPEESDEEAEEARAEEEERARDEEERRIIRRRRSRD